MYAIEEFQLDHFTGMRLNNISRFKLTEIGQYTLILGRNGSGKSRLMSMLPPQAPNKNDITEGGVWRQIINYQNTRYELTCINQKGIKCSIQNLETMEYLVENANPTVFNTTIQELFHYSKDLHEILMGKTLFTEMRTPDRRYWFSQLSESDLSYALKFFQQAKIRHRDLTGAIKDSRNQISSLKPKVLESTEERDALRARLEVLQHDIGLLDRAIARAPQANTVSLDDIVRIDAVLIGINRAVQLSNVYVDKSIVGIDRNALECDLVALKTTQDHLLSKVEDIVKRIEKFDSTERVDLEGLQSELNNLRHQVSDLLALDWQFPRLREYDESALQAAVNNYRHISDTLIDGLTALGGQYPIDNLGERYQALVNQGGELQKRINQITNQIALREDRLKHIGHTADVDCPQCKHQFKPGVRPDELAQLQQQCVQGRELLGKTQAELADIQTQIDVYRGLTETMRQLSELERFSTGPVTVLFEHLSSVAAYSVQPREHIAVVQRFGQELQRAVSLVRLEFRGRRLDDDIRLIQATQTENIGELKVIRGELDAQIAQIQLRQRDVHAQLTLLDNTQQRMEHLQRIDGQIGQLVSERQSIIATLISQARTTTIKEHRQELWDVLIIAKQRYEDMERDREQLTRLESHLTQLEVKQAAVSKIIRALSPDVGILAKHLYQCITKITDFMTAYVNRIWGYEMRILPCDVTDGELDYKFPFWANDADFQIPDISLGSKGQKEVINFVFMLAVYKAMGLEGFPLFLDELGSGFDEYHRSKMIDFIKSLVDRGHHSSVFMVSHDASTHYQLTHAAAVVIDPNGVTLPTVYNQHVTMQ